jgi:hypothetical protein
LACFMLSKSFSRLGWKWGGMPASIS